MRPILKISFCAIAFGIGLVFAADVCLAAGDLTSTTDMPSTSEKKENEPSWYREQTTKTDSLVIVQQKAQIRAQQRMDRMASMQWYGMSGSRPQSLATPFSSRYGSLWEMPGGKPYSWYPYARPGYVMYWR